MDTRTGKHRRLTHRREWEWDPAWSPDGKQIAFVSHDNERHDEIYSRNIHNPVHPKTTNCEKIYRIFSPRPSPAHAVKGKLIKWGAKALKGIGGFLGLYGAEKALDNALDEDSDGDGCYGSCTCSPTGSCMCRLLTPAA